MSILKINRTSDFGSAIDIQSNSQTERIKEVSSLRKIRNLTATALLLVLAGLASGCSQTVKAPCPPSLCPASDAGVDARSKLRSDKKSKSEESHGWADVEMVREKCGINDDEFDGGIEIKCTPFPY